MAEFCVDCFNELNGTNIKKYDCVLDYDLCEGCGEIKKTIVVFRLSGKIKMRRWERNGNLR